MKMETFYHVRNDTGYFSYCIADNQAYNYIQYERLSPCDELVTRPRTPADCPKSSNRNETESFMEAAKAQNRAVEPKVKKLMTQ
jgi:hypothetical protein